MASLKLVQPKEGKHRSLLIHSNQLPKQERVLMRRDLLRMLLIASPVHKVKTVTGLCDQGAKQSLIPRRQDGRPRPPGPQRMWPKETAKLVKSMSAGVTTHNIPTSQHFSRTQITSSVTPGSFLSPLAPQALLEPFVANRHYI